MASKKYIVRDGFVVVLVLTKTDGSTYERVYEGGEEVALEDGDAALHIHKLEFASQKDRDAALVAEKEARTAAAAANSPVDLIGLLTHALQQAVNNGQKAAEQASA